MRCLPMYMQISEAVKKQLAAGKLLPGELLPGELQLAKEFEVSRRTVRKALEVLFDEGFVLRKKGVGTTIAPPKMHNRRLRADIAIINPADDDPRYNFHYLLAPSTIYSGIIRKLAEQGHWLRYIPWSKNDPYYEINAVMQKGIDGFVFPSPAGLEDILRRVASERIPHIAYETPLEIPGLNLIVADEYRAAYDCVRNLHERGYRKIAFICGPLKSIQRNTANRRRLNGFLDACREFGITVPEHWIRTFFPDCERVFPDDYQYIRQAIVEILSAENRPEVLVLSYLHAAGEFIDVVNELQLRVPQDISAVTFSGSSNLPMLAHREQVLELSMYWYDETQLAYQGIEILQNWLLDPMFRPGTQLIPFEFHEGNSLIR